MTEEKATTDRFLTVAELEAAAARRKTKVAKEAVKVGVAPQQVGVKPIGTATFEERLDAALQEALSPTSLGRVAPEYRQPPAPGRTYEDLKQAWLPLPMEGGGMTVAQKKAEKAELAKTRPGTTEDWTEEEIFRAMMPIILTFAQEYATGRFDIEDAIQQGYLGLRQALIQDAGKSPFVQFAKLPILSAMRRASFKSDVFEVPEKEFKTVPIDPQCPEVLAKQEELSAAVKLRNDEKAKREAGLKRTLTTGEASKLPGTTRRAAEDQLLSWKREHVQTHERCQDFAKTHPQVGGMLATIPRLDMEVGGGEEGTPTTIGDLVPASARERAFIRPGELRPGEARVVSTSPEVIDSKEVARLEHNKELMTQTMRYAKLTPEENRVVSLLYGLEDAVERGTREIALMINLRPTREDPTGVKRVSEIKAQAMAKLASSAKLVRSLSKRNVPEARELAKIGCLMEAMVKKLSMPEDFPQTDSKV